jgi:glutamine amidotransferase
MITLINYGLGNIQAFVNIYKRLNIPVKVASNANDLDEVEKIILPGVGAFDWAMSRLNNSGMRARLDELVLERGCPVLGICVGMQMMANRSDEGSLSGLGWLDADVKRFEESRFIGKTHLPHMGWNDVIPETDTKLFQGLSEDWRFYFLHSFYFLPQNSKEIMATTLYGYPFASAVSRENIFGVQFHPEKSHHWGIQLLKNFALVNFEHSSSTQKLIANN